VMQQVSTSWPTRRRVSKRSRRGVIQSSLTIVTWVSKGMQGHGNGLV